MKIYVIILFISLLFIALLGIILIIKETGKLGYKMIDKFSLKINFRQSSFHIDVHYRK